MQSFPVILRRLVEVIWVLTLVLGMAGCKKDEPPRPEYTWQLTYTVSSVGDVSVDQITYLDENGTEQTLTNQRDFNLTIVVRSDFRARISARGTLTNGGVFVNLYARAFEDLTQEVSLTGSDGQSGGAPRSFTLSVERILP